MVVGYIKKLTIFSFIGLVTIGCTGQEADTDNADIKERCLNGVTYYMFKEYGGHQGYGFMSPKYNSDGKIDLCAK